MEVQERYTVTLTDILRQFGAPHTMDYLSLDVEGAEHYVMQGFDFDHYRFRLVTIERPNEALCRLLTQQGYVLLKQLKSWGETIWMHHSAAGELDMTALTSIDTEDYQYSESGWAKTASKAERIIMTVSWMCYGFIQAILFTMGLVLEAVGALHQSSPFSFCWFVSAFPIQSTRQPFRHTG